MRRALILPLLILLPLLLALPVWGQTLQQGGKLNATTASVTVANTGTATSIYSFLVPARTYQAQTTSQRGGDDLHLKLVGTLTTNQGSGAVGTANVGCNFGGSTASISVVNGQSFTSSLVAVPIELDVWVRSPITHPFVTGRLNVYTAQGTLVPYAGAVRGTTSLAAPQTLTCVWQWASAASTNSVTIHSGLLTVGN